MMRRLLSAIGAVLFCPALAFAEPLSKPVDGPKLVCFKYSIFSLLPGEHVTDSDGSPESTRVKVSGRYGSYEIGESEIFATPKTQKTLVQAAGNTKIYLFAGHRKIYGIFGPTSYSDGEDRLVIILSGGALHGNKRDAAIYERFAVRDPASVECQAGFTYSWGAFLSGAGK
jgi:hypothetical protein